MKPPEKNPDKPASAGEPESHRHARPVKESHFDQSIAAGSLARGSAETENHLERFQIMRKLGEGGMGQVHEAIDLERDMRVALKTLRNLTPRGIQRLKREFRALADVSHANVVDLYELVTARDELCIVMELVEGVDLLDYLRPGSSPAKRLPRVALGSGPDLGVSVPGHADNPLAQLTRPTRALAAQHDGPGATTLVDELAGESTASTVTGMLPVTSLASRIKSDKGMWARFARMPLSTSSGDRLSKAVFRLAQTLPRKLSNAADVLLPNVSLKWKG